MLNGRFSDVNGHITCTANGGSSVVDYLVASTELFRSVTDFVVDNFDVSDHFPVVWKLKLNPTIKIGEEQPKNRDTNLEPFDAYTWQESAKDCFIEAFEGLFVNFQRSVDNDIANSQNAFLALYKEAGTRMKRTYPKNKT